MTPGEMANIEQCFKAMAEMTWNYYRELINAGFNELQATSLTGNFVIASFGKSFESPE